MKKIIALLLAALLVLSVFPAFAFAEEAENEENRIEAVEEESAYHAEEVIYGVLSAEGKVNKLLPVVVIDAAEETELEYYGDFADVQNLSDTNEIKAENGKVELQVPQGRFYFESELKAASLPWLIDISYILDGKKISAGELGGRDGRLEIGIDIKENPEGDKSFFDTYLLQISLTLDSLKCRNIIAEGATMANVGSNKMINFMAMPGTETSLKLTADVTDFSMGGMSIAAVPSSMAEMLEGIDGVTEGIDKFGSALNQLSEGVSMLAGGAGGLRDGFGVFSAGLTELSKNSGALVSGSEQILGGIRQISDMVAALKELAPDVNLGTLEFVPQALYSLADAIEQAAQTLAQSKTQIDETISAISGMLDQVADISEEELQALQQQNPDSQALQLLIMNYRVLIALRDSWYQAVENFVNASDNMGGIIDYLMQSAENARNIAKGLEAFIGSGGSGELDAYLDQLIGLGDNYAMFHEGLVQYTGGVDALAQAAVPLYNGTDMLADGTNELNAGTSRIPESLDDMLEGMAGEEFEPHSFLSEKNENVQIVQFVMSTEGISAPEQTEQSPEAEKEKTGFDLFLQRLSELFKKPGDTEE